MQKAASMARVDLCRVCLASNMRMYIIEHTELQTIFENLTSTPLVTRDGRPESICYICHAYLQRCCRFRDMSRRAENLLTMILNQGEKHSQDVINGCERIPHTLSISPTKLTFMPDNIKDESPEVLIKVETLEFVSNTSIEDQTGDAAVQIELNNIMTTTLKEEFNSTESDGEILDTLFTYSRRKLSKKGKTIKSHADIKCRKRNKDVAKRKKQLSENRKHPMTCRICNQKFKEKVYVKEKHLNTNTDAKSFIACDNCAKTLSNSHDSKKYFDVLQTEKIHVCDVCSKTFISKYSLQIHISQKHMKLHTVMKSHACERCNKKFFHRGTLRLHMRIHTGDKPYACEKCTKAFSQKGTLQRHMRLHTGEKPYACDKCSKTFNQEGSLKRHIKMHTGEKPYACDRCGKAYYESSHLKRHIRTHTGEKPYACDRCFQTFSQSSNLVAHMKKHTGEKPTKYACYECNKTFDHKSIFKRHILIHTREKPYPCDKCDKKYADKRSLQRHILMHK